MKRTILQRDFASASERFPKLNLSYLREHKLWCVRGDLDICDVEGAYWDTFDIGIFISKGYPYNVPVVYELSKKIPRDIDWHVDNNGECCVDIPHTLCKWSKKGIHISDFIALKVYPFFANYLYKKMQKKYANGEYAHHFDGIAQFYKEELNLPENTAVTVLSSLLAGMKPERNTPCPCGSGKRTKECHMVAMNLLSSLGVMQLKKDMEGFLMLLKKSLVTI